MTFLLTDIEGSTRRWEDNSEEMRGALARHDEVLGSAIEAQGGWLFKHTGDGVCAAFSSPHAAVAAAIDAQRRLGLPVRMGLATGEAELRSGDYYGPTVNRAARVMAGGHGGQILLAGETAGLVRGVDLRDLGSHRLRDLGEPVRLYQVCADGVGREFPPPRTVEVSPGNLRPAGSSFVGRDRELDELEAAVRTHRLVTLTGAGGIGKTRLAVQVAARLSGDFPEGVWMVELASVGDPGVVPDAVAGVLGIAQQPGLSVAESVAVALEGRLRLVVVDNCEHVIDAAAELIELMLAGSSTIRVLATSREGLRVADEHVWPVPSLSAREGADSEGVRLFVERAQAAVPRFEQASPGDADAVVEICRRLDGMPLAIELAASRMVSMSPAEVRDRLDDRFRLLAGSRRGVERHQTLRAAVQWSFDLLSVDEQQLLRCCSVFAGGFDLAGAVAISGGEEFAVLDLLDALVRKSLVVAERAAGATRFGMLETIRSFAEEQLAALRESANVRDAHASYFAGCYEPVVALWDSPRQRASYEWFERELANLRAAFRWAAGNEDLDTASQIAVLAAFLGNFTSRLEPVAWAEELLAPAEAAEHPRLAALCVMASRCAQAGRPDEAVGFAEKGAALLDNPHYSDIPLAFGRALAGAAYIYVGDAGRWADLCRQNLARGDASQVLARGFLVNALSMNDDTLEVPALVDGLIDAAKATGNPLALIVASGAVSFAFYYTDPPAALEHLRAQYRLCVESGNRAAALSTLAPLTNLEVDLGQQRDALGHLDDAIRAFHDAGAYASLRGPLSTLAVLLDQLGRDEPARVLVSFIADVPFIQVVAARLEDLLRRTGDQHPTTEATPLNDRAVKMDASAIAGYALEQIEQAVSQLPRSDPGAGMANTDR